MTVRDSASLKAFFETGDRPTEGEFGDLIDTMFDQNLRVFNVRSPTYGATGDGSTDDTTAVQATLTAALDGSVTSFPQATGYLTSGSLNYFGEKSYIGNRGFPLKLADTSNPAALFVADQYEAADQATFQTETQAEKFRTAWRDLQLDGNKANNLTNGHGILAIPYLGIFEDLFIFDFREDGLHLRHDSALNDAQNAGFNLLFNFINKVRIEGCEGWGAFLGADFNGKMTDGHINDLTIFDCKDGATIGSAQGWLASNARISQVDDGLMCGHVNRTLLENIIIDNFGFGQDAAQTVFTGIHMGSLVATRALCLLNNAAIMSDATGGAGDEYRAITFQGGSVGTDKAVVITGVGIDLNTGSDMTGIKQISDTDNDVTGVISAVAMVGDGTDATVPTPLDIISGDILVKDIKHGKKLQSLRRNDYGHVNKSLHLGTDVDIQEGESVFRFKKDAVTSGSAQNIVRLDFGTPAAWFMEFEAIVSSPDTDSAGYVVKAQKVAFNYRRHSSGVNGTVSALVTIADTAANSENAGVRDISSMVVTATVTAAGQVTIATNVAFTGSSAPSSYDVAYKVSMIGWTPDPATGTFDIVPL